MGIKYYRKFIEEEGRWQYEERYSESSDPSMEEITQSEYEASSASQWAEYLASLSAESVNQITEESDYVADAL